jgi:hypothetical protein
MFTDWRDYNTEDNTSLEMNLQNHRPGCAILATEIDPNTELRHGDWFINYDTVQQTNSITGTVRLVRRVMVTSPRTELPTRDLGRRQFPRLGDARS